MDSGVGAIMGSTAISEAIPEKETGRQSWSDYFIGLAEHIATRSTCERLKVGCVFVKDSRILSTGYNGSLPGRQHCIDVGCLVHENHCVRAVHAEENAVAQAAQHGVSLQHSWLYVTHLPCLRCYKLCLAAGVDRVYYRQAYGGADLNIYRLLQGMSRLEQLP
jgi:dCMP deaminase